MSKVKDARWTEKYAREVIERADRRNLSNSALARELGVSPQRIAWWRKRLQDAQPSTRPPATQPSTQPAFVEVKLAAPASRPFAIRTKSDRTIEAWPGFDANELARLITVVEDAPC